MNDTSRPTPALFSELNENLHASGLLRSDARGTIVRLAIWFVMLACLWWAAWLLASPWLATGLALAISILQGQFAFVGHDASHGSAVDSNWGNRLTGSLAMGLVAGLCFREWQHRHLLHHKHCQDEKRDPDMQFGTVFSLSANARAEKVGLGRLIAPYQGWYFWPSTLLFAYSLRVFSFIGAARNPKKYAVDLLSVLAHAVLFVALPLLVGVDAGRVALIYGVSSCFLGLRLATVFTVNHVGMPERIPGATHLEHQLATSRNIDNSSWMDWYFGGLNFQIEHHLFPGCPRRRLRRARTRVRPTLIGEKLHYHETSWSVAVADVTRHVHRIGRGSLDCSVSPSRRGARSAPRPFDR